MPARAALPSNSVSTAGRFSRVVSMEAYCPEPQELKLMRALSRSNSSESCWRVCLRVPRMSMAVVIGGALPRLRRLASSPKRSDSAANTAPPRVFLGSSASSRPPGSFTRRGARLDVGGRGVERLALFLGRIALVVLDQRDDIGRRGNLRAVGSLGGIEEPGGAIRRLEYRAQTRCTSAVFTARSRSRFTNMSRQSPMPAQLDRSRPMRSELLSASSICLRICARARSTSASVMGLAAGFSTMAMS